MSKTIIRDFAYTPEDQRFHGIYPSIETKEENPTVEDETGMFEEESESDDAEQEWEWNWKFPSSKSKAKSDKKGMFSFVIERILIM
jgi:hypothetical protein